MFQISSETATEHYMQAAAMLQTGEITRLLRFVEINNWRTVQQTFIFLVKSVNLFSFIAEIVVAGECIIYCC